MALALLNFSVHLPSDTQDDGSSNKAVLDEATYIIIIVIGSVVLLLLMCLEYRRKFLLPEYYERRERELSVTTPATDINKIHANKSHIYSAVTNTDEDMISNPNISLHETTLVQPLMNPIVTSEPYATPPRASRLENNQNQNQNQNQNRTPTVAFPRSNTFNTAPINSTPTYAFPRSTTLNNTYPNSASVNTTPQGIQNTTRGSNLSNASYTDQFYRSSNSSRLSLPSDNNSTV